MNAHMKSRSAGRIVIASRFWGETENDLFRLWRFVIHCNTYLSDICMMMVIAVNEQKDRVGSAAKLISRQRDPNLPIRLEVLPVCPWGGVTHALNLLVHHVRVLLPQSELIMFQSPEVLPQKEVVQELMALMAAFPNTLTVGPAFEEHRLPPKVSNGFNQTIFTPLSADICPWNTMALWDIQKLVRTGFPSAADDVTPPGMEEIGVIALQQMLFGSMKAMARIYYGPRRVNWFTDFDDAGRQERHKQKLASKVSRGVEVIKILGLEEKGLHPLVTIHFRTPLSKSSHFLDCEGKA